MKFEKGSFGTYIDLHAQSGKNLSGDTITSRGERDYGSLL